MAKTTISDGLIPMRLTLKPIYDKGGIKIYEQGVDLYWLTNDSNTVNYVGSKEEIQKICPDWTG